MYEIIPIQPPYPFIFQVTNSFMSTHTITSAIWVIFSGFQFDFVKKIQAGLWPMPERSYLK